ncbi:MAG: hypothetical protein IJM98_07210 [Oscillospiraceae bacterium]|nr:hypothetical protein [Oscillospiraceae bacterium]
MAPVVATQLQQIHTNAEIEHAFLSEDKNTHPYKSTIELCRRLIVARKGVFKQPLPKFLQKNFEKIFLNGKKRPFLAVFVGIKQNFTGKF